MSPEQDDDWDALGGASDGAPEAAPVPDADPFGGADDPFGGDGMAPAPAAHGSMDDMFGGGDESAAPADDIFGGTMQGNLMNSPPRPAEPAANGSMDDMFGSSAPAAPMMMAHHEPVMVHHDPVPQVDDSLIEQWERQKRAELQKRREEGSKKVSAQNEVGKKALEDFEARRKADVQKAQAKNKTEETSTIAAMEAALKAGLVGKESWDKVCTYLDLSGDPKRNNAISRMKSVLIAIKSSPPAEKKNFGA